MAQTNDKPRKAVKSKNQANAKEDMPKVKAKRPIKNEQKATSSVKANSKTSKKQDVSTNIKKRKNSAPAKKPLPKVKVFSLGGLNEIGKNITCIECENDIIVVDCGIGFPDDDMLGVDLVIPDITYLKKNINKVKGIVITHGHEDHIGAIPYILRDLDVPIYCTALAGGIISSKLEEHKNIKKAKIHIKKAGDRFKLGVFDIEMIHINTIFFIISLENLN